MRELERILPEETRAFRSNELLAHEPLENGAHLRPLRRELEDGTAPELLADDGGALEEGALISLQAVNARCEKGLDRRWDFWVSALLLKGERDHLLDEE